MKTLIKKINRLDLAKQLNGLKTDTIILVIDEKIIAELPNLENLEKKIISVTVSGGEACKTFSTYEKVCEEILNHSPHRNAYLVAIGGGATTDLAGFVAATILRGIKWITIPTTLLSMVDASIGGKVAINSGAGKNLVGAFHQPSEVWLDQQFLSTLSEKELSSGKGEIVKYAMLDLGIYKLIENSAPLKEIIEACLKYKKKIIEIDYKEKNVRKYLNLGHTFGHALEKNYNIPHGIAVLYGMRIIINRYCSPKILESFNIIVKKMGLEIYLNQTISADQSLLKLITKDKKRISENEIELVVLDDIGKPSIKKVQLDQL